MTMQPAGGDRNQSAERSWIEALQDPQSDASARVLADLRNMMVGVATKRMAGEHSRREAESVVQSVLVRQVGRLPKLLEHCTDDAHLRRYMLRALRNKIQDDREKHRPHELPRDSEGRTAIQPSAGDPGPATRAESLDLRHVQGDASQRLVDLIRGQSKSDAELRLVELYVIRGLRHRQIAQLAATTEGASKVAMTRFRQRVLPIVIGPLRSRLSAEEWAVAEQALVFRQKPGKTGEILGLDESSVELVLSARVLPELIEEYGSDSADALMRLLGVERH